MTDQGEDVDIVYLDLSKAIDSVCHRLLVKKIVAMGIHLKKTSCVVVFLTDRTLRVKLGGHLSSKGTVKSGVPQGCVLGPLLLLTFINHQADELTCNHLFYADDVRLIAPKRQQQELRWSIQQALSWSRRWGLPLNVSLSHHLSIGGPLDLLLALSEDAEGKQMQKCGQSNDVGIPVNSAFTFSANVFNAANKASGMLYFINR